MRHFVFALMLGVSAGPVVAEDVEEGFSLMEEGARMIMRGMLEELDPAIEDFTAFAEEFTPELRRFAEEMGPALEDLISMIDSFGYYMAPEVLPNGDIIIRRRPEAPAFEPNEPIEL